MNRASRRKQNFVNSFLPQFRRDSKIARVFSQPAKTLLPQLRLRLRVRRLPMWIREPWPPPVLRRVVFLPEQSDFARVVGQQVLTGKAHGYGESLRALTHQHHMASVGHNFFRYL